MTNFHVPKFFNNLAIFSSPQTTTTQTFGNVIDMSQPKPQPSGMEFFKDQNIHGGSVNQPQTKVDTSKLLSRNKFFNC
jgi:hypothetical protein